MDNNLVGANASVSAMSSVTSTERKRKSNVIESAIGLQDVMKTITKLCGTSMETPVAGNVKVEKKKGIEQMTLQELYDMLEQYKRQIKFLKEMDMLSEDEKTKMVDKTKLIFEEIDKRTVNRGGVS